MEIDGQTISEWVSVLDYLEATEMNNAITVAAFPKMKKAEQIKISQQLQRRMNPQTSERRPITTADMARILGDVHGG